MSVIHRVRAWLSMLDNEREESELAEEIRFHVDSDVQQLIVRGHSREQAVKLASARFGNIDHVRERARDQRYGNWSRGTMKDLVYALRSFRRAPAFTVVAMVTLALGIGATTLAFTLVNSVLLRPLPYRDAGRLVLMSELDKGGERLWPSYPNFIDWRTQSHSFDGVASLMFPFGMTARGNGEVVRVRAMGVSEKFFRTLGVTPEVGREFTPEENRSPDGAIRSVMVTHEFWMNELGGERDLSRVHMSANGNPVAVIGVLPAGFHFAADADLFFPHELWPGTIRSAHNYMVVGRLANGATVESAHAEMKRISDRLKATYGDETQAVDVQIVPLHDFVVGDQRHLLLLLLAASSLVLLIACVNLVSAQLARATVRERDMSVRAALGASRGRLVRQLLIESVALSAAGAAAGVVLAVVLLGAIRSAGAGMIPRMSEVRLDLRALAFAGITAVIAILVTGVYPALRSSRRGIQSLRTRGMQSGNDGSSPVWSLLIGAEAALAVMLVIGSGLLIRSMHNILSMNPGFDANGLLTVTMSPDEPPTLELIQRMESEVRSLPGVQSAAMVNVLPLHWGDWYGPVLRPGDPPAKWPAMAGFRMISPSYFEALRLPIIRGRAFTDADRAGSPRSMIVTKPLADKLWPGQDPIGQRLKTNYVYDTVMTVVGVVPEAQNWQYVGSPQNEVYVPIAQNMAVRAGSSMNLVVRTSTDPSVLAGAVRARLKQIAPGTPITMQTMKARIEDTARDRRFAMLVLAGFASVALLLAAIGIYGVVSYSVAVRTREIGVRMALGATSGSVLQASVSRTATTAGIGVVAGLVGGALGARALQGLLFGVVPLDRATFVAGAAVLMAVALLSALIPAYRASRTDPLVALRAD